MLVAFAYTLLSSKAPKPKVIATNTKQEICRNHLSTISWTERSGSPRQLLFFLTSIPKCHPLIFVKVSKNSSIAIIEKQVSFYDQ